MFKKFALVAALSLISSGAFAACTNPLAIKDGTGAAISMSVTNNTDGFCSYNMTLNAETTKVIGTVRVASGGIASGAIASGAVASGAIVDLGAQADSAAAADTSTASLIALLKRTNQNLTTLNTTAGGAVPAGTNNIGKVTPNDGTNSVVYDPCQIVATVRTPISISTAANIKIVTGTASKKTHICGMMLFSAGTTNVGIVEGSGTNCGTSALGLIGGATAATGPNLTAQAGFLAAPAGYAIASTTVNANDICLINSAAIQVSGYIVTATP